MPPNSFTLTGISPAKIVALEAKLKASGATMTTPTPNQMQIVGQGVEALAAYDPATLVLTVAVTKKPFFVSMAHIEASLKENLA